MAEPPDGTAGTPAGEPARADGGAGPPLYVDLDGTLIRSDSLVESVRLLLRHRPLDGLRIPFWLARGRAALKQALAARALPDPEALPYRPEVLAVVRRARTEGRRTVLATAAHRRIAHGVAEHLALFDHVIASDASTNRKGVGKLAAIVADADGGPFEYLGDSAADLPIWRAAGGALLVAGRPALARRLRAEGLPVRIVAADAGTEARARGGLG